MPVFLIKQAAGLLGVSTDTLRRWADRGRVETTTDGSGRLAVDGAALAGQLAEPADHEQGEPVVAHSMRNRFTGLVTRVTRDTVMAQVEIEQPLGHDHTTQPTGTTGTGHAADMVRPQRGGHDE
jgi:excisionase family DNA binding protein